ncbi:MAG TPA: DUF2723 domain-containing protein [Saprospiraceae bacterium]|nr:DUF2723 domain-containing protein [Saprospiraceae bacterium]
MMESIKRAKQITGLLIFLITFTVFFFSVERTGSLWDCGEFILGAHKLQVVHPPGAALFLLIGRMFAGFADLISSNPADIAFSVNLMSGLCTSLAAVFMGWVTMIFGRILLVGKGGYTEKHQNLLLSGAGLATGLATAFSTSIWFSAVEGEVYAMSTFFTALTFWAAVHWYQLEDNKESDRWLLLAIYSGALSTGVHLLSILAYPAIGMLVYFKKYKKHNFTGMALSAIAGMAAMVFVQKLVIVGIPALWQMFEIPMVNGLGMPFHSGLLPVIALIGGLSWFLLRYAQKKGSYLLHLCTLGAILTVIGFSSIGVIVIRANADTPINMNVPSDAVRLIPYLNREQYGERPLLKGPHYEADVAGVNRTERYGRVGNRYEIVDEKYEPTYNDRDMMLFPRIGHNDENRKQLHNYWRNQIMENPKGKPDMAYNLKFMWKYQLGWMYFRYFMWNFTGRQNGKQGYFPWDLSSGHWISGVKFIDEMRLYNKDYITDTMRNDQSKNRYYFLPLLLGLLGMVFHYSGNRKDFMALLAFFILTGIGIIIYSNQPPNEPRERDYVLVGSFMTFCIWIGLAALAVFDLIKVRIKTKPAVLAGIASLLVLTAPVIMGFQNYDDHSRLHQYAARDYASNFLNSLEPNAIIFTYGDNDTYPLWYAQEVENIRTDVRVVNLSLIQVDWYINKLRSKVNDSEPIQLSISEDAIRGRKRNQVFLPPNDRTFDLDMALRYIGDPKNEQNNQTLAPSRRWAIHVDKARVMNNSTFKVPEGKSIDSLIRISFDENQRYITKDELMILDVISSNFYDRPIYFAVTTVSSKLLGLHDNTQLEGLALRVVPWSTPSDKSLSIYGSGMAATDILYDNIMTKWRWGNFDQKRLYVNESYSPAINAMRMAMIRAGSEYLNQGNSGRAAELMLKYFEAFPHFNFPYDKGTLNPLNILVRAGDTENAKKHIRILAEETRQKLIFFESLDQYAMASFQDDYKDGLEVIRFLEALSSNVNDAGFKDEISGMLGTFLRG